MNPLRAATVELDRSVHAVTAAYRQSIAHAVSIFRRQYASGTNATQAIDAYAAILSTASNAYVSGLLEAEKKYESALHANSQPHNFLKEPDVMDPFLVKIEPINSLVPSFVAKATPLEAAEEQPPGTVQLPIWGPPGSEFPDLPGYPPVATQPPLPDTPPTETPPVQGVKLVWVYSPSEGKWV